MQKLISIECAELTSLDGFSEKELVYLLLTGYIRSFPNQIGRHMQNVKDWCVEKKTKEKIAKLSSPGFIKPHPLILYFPTETICVVIQCDNVERQRSYTLDVVYDECEEMGYIDTRNSEDIKLVFNSVFTVQYGLTTGRTFMTLVSYRMDGKFSIQHLYELAS